MKLLFFAPHSAIWVHAFPEALIAEALKQSGHEVIYIDCGRALSSYCVPMAAHGLRWNSPKKEKLKVCKICDDQKRLLKQTFTLDGGDLASELTTADTASISGFVDSVSRTDVLNAHYRGINVGRYALYSLLIARKKSQIIFTDEEWGDYQVALHNSCVAVVACEAIFKRERPDAVLVYNSLYSVNRVCVEYARRCGVTAHFLHAGGNLAYRLQGLMLGRDHWFDYIQHLVKLWKGRRDQPCGMEELAPVTDHFVELFAGNSAFVYSNAVSTLPTGIRKRYGILPRQRVLLATMSSYDELFAAQILGVMPGDDGLCFTTQIDWLRATIEWIKARPDLFLLIRVHPREFPNKRDGEKSEHAGELEHLFRELPQNVQVNWPADGQALYDVAEESDVILNAWSSAGKELSLLGLPVVIYAPQYQAYPPDLAYVGTTVASYFSSIDQALAAGWSSERLRLAYRWHALELGAALIDISDSYAERESRRGISWAARAYRAVARRIVPYYIQRRDCSRRALSLRNAGLVNAVIREQATSPLAVQREKARSPVTLEEETAILRLEIKKLIVARYGENPEAVFSSGLRQKLLEFAKDN